MADYTLDNEDGSLAVIRKDGILIKKLSPSFSASGQIADNGIYIYLASHNWSYLFVTEGNTLTINGSPADLSNKDDVLSSILVSVFPNTNSGSGGTTGTTEMDDMTQGTTKKYVTAAMYNFIVNQMGVDNP